MPVYPTGTVRYNWRNNLSAPRYSPDQIEAQRLRNEAAQNRLNQFPLEQASKEAQFARVQGEEAKARYQLQKEIETDRQKAAFYNGLQELETNLNAQGFGIGTKQHAEAFAAYAHAFPLARSSADVNKTLALHAKINDDQAALTQRVQRVLGAVPQGYTPRDLTLTASGQPSIRFGTNVPPERVAARYANLQGMIASHNELMAQEAAANPDKPYSLMPRFQAAQTEAAMLERQYPGLKAQPDQGDQTAPTNPDEIPTLPPQIITDQATNQTATPAAAPAAPASTAVPPAATISPVDHSAALDWANANPNDPRAAVIIERARAAMPDQNQSPDEEQ